MTIDTEPTSYYGLASELRDAQERLEHHRQWAVDHDTTPPGDLNPTAYYLTNAITALDTAIREATLAAQELEESRNGLVDP